MSWAQYKTGKRYLNHYYLKGKIGLDAALDAYNDMMFNRYHDMMNNGEYYELS